jgi:hypothetical protein
MKAGQITAKLRDAVPVHFFEDGEDRIHYRNIDIPESLKTLEIMDFGFDISAEGKITFRVHFDNGILPAIFPPIREKMTRTQMAAAKAAKTEEARNEATAGTAVVAEAEDEEAPGAESVPEATDTPEQPERMEARFNATGDRRKALVAAISEHLNQTTQYLGAPSFIYAVGAYRIDKTGTLTGEPNPKLLAALECCCSREMTKGSVRGAPQECSRDAAGSLNGAPRSRGGNKIATHRKAHGQEARDRARVM